MQLNFNNHFISNESIILVRRRVAEEESGEGELEGGGVAIDHLAGDVQIDGVALVVHIV